MAAESQMKYVTAVLRVVLTGLEPLLIELGDLDTRCETKAGLSYEF